MPGQATVTQWAVCARAQGTQRNRHVQVAEVGLGFGSWGPPARRRLAAAAAPTPRPGFTFDASEAATGSADVPGSACGGRWRPGPGGPPAASRE